MGILYFKIIYLKDFKKIGNFGRYFFVEDYKKVFCMLIKLRCFGVVSIFIYSNNK